MRTPAPPRRWMSWPCGSSQAGRGFCRGGPVCPPPVLVSSPHYEAHTKNRADTQVRPYGRHSRACRGRIYAALPVWNAGRMVCQTYMSDPTNAKPSPVKDTPDESVFNNPFPVAIDPPITPNRFPQLSVFLPSSLSNLPRPRGCCFPEAHPRGAPCPACARACRRPPASAPGRRVPRLPPR